MQNHTTVHASVVVLAALAVVFLGGGVDDFTPLSEAAGAFCEQVAKVLHVDFWTRLAGVPDLS